MSEDTDIDGLACRLERLYRGIHKGAMVGIPIVNPALEVEIVGQMRLGEDCLCVLLTPWFMNLVLVPANGRAHGRTGDKTTISLPGGRVEFIQSIDDEIGPYLMCSLMSPVFEFSTQEDAVETARQVLAAFLADDAGEPDADADMVAIWEGRLPEPETLSDLDVASVTPVPQANGGRGTLSRRALVGLGGQRGASS